MLVSSGWSLGAVVFGLYTARKFGEDHGKRGEEIDEKKVIKFVP